MHLYYEKVTGEVIERKNIFQAIRYFKEESKKYDFKPKVTWWRNGRVK